MTTAQILTETFTTKEGYLAWRMAWRAAYAQLSGDIRLMKQITRDNCQNPISTWVEAAGGKAGYWKRNREWTPAELARQEASVAMFVRAREPYQLGFKGMPKLAAALMKRRAWSKEEAQKQYQAQHAVPAV